jgi:transcriptional regulator with XRE-family HTH domain
MARPAARVYGIDPLIAQLRTIRRAKDLTQDEVGSLMGRCNTYVSAVETGRIEPGVKMLRRFADALGCDITLTAKQETVEGT